MKNKKAWVHGLVVTILSSLGAGVVLAIKSPSNFNLQSDWKNLVFTSLAFGIFAAGNYLFQNKLVFDDEVAPTNSDSGVVQVPIKQNPNITVRLSAAFLAATMFVTGCTGTAPITYHDVVVTAQKGAPFIKPSVTAAATLILELADNDAADRQAKANLIYGLARGFRTLLDGKPHDATEIQAIVSQWTGDTLHWTNLGVIISGFVSTGLSQVSGDPKSTIDLIEQVAEGLEDAANSVK